MESDLNAIRSEMTPSAERSRLPGGRTRARPRIRCPEPLGGVAESAPHGVDGQRHVLGKHSELQRRQGGQAARGNALDDRHLGHRTRPAISTPPRPCAPAPSPRAPGRNGGPGRARAARPPKRPASSKATSQASSPTAGHRSSASGASPSNSRAVTKSLLCRLRGHGGDGREVTARRGVQRRHRRWPRGSCGARRRHDGRPQDACSLCSGPAPQQAALTAAHRTNGGVPTRRRVAAGKERTRPSRRVRRPLLQSHERATASAWPLQA